MVNNLKFWIATLFTVMVITLLLSGSHLLSYTLDSFNTLPLGNLITWAGMLSLPLSVYWGIKPYINLKFKPHKYLNRSLKIAISLGFLWAPLAYVLAGNFSFTFKDKQEFQSSMEAMEWFWKLNYTAALLPLLILFCFFITRPFLKKQ